ncbi:MAG: HIT domain-containing protein [Patescibacteria group bacterium]
MRCAYCELPEIKAREITGNDLAWVFPTNIPIVPGHILIAPRRCVAKYEDLTRDEKDAIESLRVSLVKALTKLFGAEGFNFAWNDGKLAGQSVPHFHLHVLPRKMGDAGIWQYEPRQFLYRPGEREATPEAELLGVAESIRAAL